MKESTDWLNDAVKGKEEAQLARSQPITGESRPRGEAKQELQQKLDTETTQEDRHIAKIEVIDAGFEVVKGVQRKGLPDAWEDSPHTANIINALIRFLNSSVIMDEFQKHSDERTKKLLEKLASGKMERTEIHIKKGTPRRYWELKQSPKIQELLKDNRVSINTLNKVFYSITTMTVQDWEDLVHFVPQYSDLKRKADDLKAIFKLLGVVDFDGLPIQVKLRTEKLAREIAEEMLQVFGYQVIPR